MDDNKKIELKVGVFIIAGTIAIMVSLFLLGADRALFNKYVSLNAYFEQTQGLAKGSIVSLSGMVIGNIKSIEFVEGKSELKVNLKIDEAYLPKITKGSMVDIRTQGALGDKYIFIIPGSPTGQALQDGDTLEVTKSSDLITVLGQRASEAEKIFDILNNLQIITGELASDQKIGKIVSNLNNASKSLESTGEESKKLMSSLNNLHFDKSLKASLEKMDRILTKLDQGQGTLGALINDPTLHEQVSQLLGGANRKKYFKSMIRTSIEQAEKK